MDATLEPARRMITKLLEADADFFREYHYLNPLMVDSSDQVALQEGFAHCNLLACFVSVRV
jgi:hypothetical protein